jgi:hypothetical protein
VTGPDPWTTLADPVDVLDVNNTYAHDVPPPDPGPMPTPPEPTRPAAPDPAAAELTRLRARRDAQAALAQETARDVQIPAGVRLDEFLTQSDAPVQYRIDRLLPEGGNVVLAAAYKAGKSTLAGELLRSLADGTALFGEFPVRPARRIALIDDELNPATLRAWLRDHNITNTDRVTLWPLRGQVHLFDLRDDSIRARWATMLAGTDVLILDCLRPILDALGLDENREAGLLLYPLDQLTRDAGISENVVLHHMGHLSERARGSSRILDWPDVSWKLVRQTEEGAEPSHTDPRYFSALGRDVDIPETRVHYDPGARRLSWGSGSRRGQSAGDALEAVMQLLAGEPDGMTTRTMDVKLAASRTSRDVRAARKWGVEHGCLTTEPGPRRAVVYALSAAVRRSAAGGLAAVVCECGSALRDNALHSHSAAPLAAALDAPHSKPLFEDAPQSPKPNVGQRCTGPSAVSLGTSLSHLGACRLCSEPIDPAAGDTHPSCDGDS